MPLFMDVHKVDEVDPDALAAAHERDLEVQSRYGVDFQRYWFSRKPGRVYCLVDAPDPDAAEAVHHEAHGMLADEIELVEEGH